MLELDLHAEGQVPLFGERVYHLNDQVRARAAGADPDDRSALSLHAEQGLAESARQHGAHVPGLVGDGRGVHLQGFLREGG